MRAHAESTPSKWTGCEMQQEKFNPRLNIFWRYAMRLPPKMRFSIALKLALLSSRCVEWAVMFEPQIFQKIKALAMQRLNHE